LNEDVQHRLKVLIQDVVDKHNCEIIELEMLEEHVHLLVECPPQLGIHKLVKRIKGLSSRTLRKEFLHLRTRLPTLWTNSYFVSTVGGAPLEIIKKYIEDQKNK
jgi:putative transposase